MLTHCKFGPVVSRDGYEIRSSIDAPYDRVIEVSCEHGKGHIEVRMESSFVAVTNGPLFYGGKTTYVAAFHKDGNPVSVGVFSDQIAAEKAIVACLAQPAP